MAKSEMNPPRLLLLLILCLIGSGCRSETVYVNELSDHSYDLALKMSLKLAREKSGAEFALVKLASLPAGKTIGQVAVDLMKDLQVGARSGSRGVLILYSHREQQVKIEIGYGLEGVLPDAAVHRLEAAAGTYFLSDLSQDYFSELLITLSNAIRDGRISAEEWDSGSWLATELSGGAGIKAAIASKDPEQIMALVRKLLQSGEKRFLPEITPEATLELYLESLEEGIGDPSLPLLTEGSRVFRVAVPRSVSQQHRIARDYRKAGLSRLLRNQDLALAVFRPNTSTLPVVLEKEKSGRWLIDEVKSWTWFHRFEDSTAFHLLTDDNPFREDLMRIPIREAKCTIFKKRFSLPREPFVSKGDEAFFKFGLFARAIELYQAELVSNPARSETRWKLYHALMNLSMMQPALDQLEELYRQSSANDRELREWRFAYREAYREVEAQATPNSFYRFFLRTRNGLEKIWKILGDLLLPQDSRRCLDAP